METRMPAECFPPWEFIFEEIEARGWSVVDLAERMGGDNIDVTLCTLELMRVVQPRDPRLMMGQATAEKLAKAFGTSVELWLGLDQSWREWLARRK